MKTSRASVALHSTDEFRAASDRGIVLPLRKELVGVEIREEASGRLSFVLSTATPDRMHDVIVQEGWRTEHYLKNPVVLWAHDYRAPPVARSPSVAVDAGRLVAREVEFPGREDFGELSEFGWAVEQMYRRGFLNAVSVGFRPVKYNWNDDHGGMDFHEQELLEWSAVPVPANPEALIGAKAAGIPLDGMARWAQGILDCLPQGTRPDPDDPASSARDLAARAWKTMRQAGVIPASVAIPRQPETPPAETPAEAEDMGGCQACCTAAETCAVMAECCMDVARAVGGDACRECCQECAAAADVCAQSCGEHGCATCAASCEAAAVTCRAAALLCSAPADALTEAVPGEGRREAVASWDGKRIDSQLATAIADEARRQIAAMVRRA